MTYDGDDATHGQKVHWYYGGVQATQSATLESGDISAGYLALTTKAEQGSVVLTVDGTVTAAIQHAGATGGAVATDSTGVLSISYADMTEGDVLAITYLDISVTTLTEVAMSQDVKTSWKGDETSETVGGQVNKIKVTGAIEQTADLEKLDYTQTFMAAFLGEQVADASGNKTYTTKYTGFNKVGALVGKKLNTLGAVVRKYFMYGVQPSGAEKNFSSAGIFKESLSLNVDEYSGWEAA